MIFPLQRAVSLNAAPVLFMYSASLIDPYCVLSHPPLSELFPSYFSGSLSLPAY